MEKYIKETESWLDNNPTSEKSDYDNKFTELETKFKEIISVCETGNGSKENVDKNGDDDDGEGPQIEEID